MAKYAQQRTLQVYAHWIGLEQPMLMGLLHSTQLRGKEIFSFSVRDGQPANVFFALGGQRCR
jgi:serine/threonine-protein kinase HipA